MESLTLCISSSSPFLKYHKITQTALSHSSNSHRTQISKLVHSLTTKTSLKPHLTIPTFLGHLSSSLPSFASEIPDPIPDKINLESILVSVDEFFNKYPYFVAGVTFIWLILIPVLQEYLNKYRFMSALNAFRKLRDDPSAQLLDIRDEKSVAYIASPNLRILNKDVVYVPFDEADESGFLRNVLEKFADPKNTIVCILDNFDGNSMKVAEELFKNGFKEAYAIEGGVRGKKGWQEIQQEYLPPSVHVFPKNKVKKSQREDNGAVTQPDAEQMSAAASEK